MHNPCEHASLGDNTTDINFEEVDVIYGRKGGEEKREVNRHRAESGSVKGKTNEGLCASLLACFEIARRKSSSPINNDEDS